ncbi:MAG: hypothetical protein U1E36_02240 [Rickettsiales bacterium]
MTELTQLGANAKAPENPEEAVLEKVENPHLNVDYSVRLPARNSPRSAP